MGGEHWPSVCPRIVLQIMSLEASRRLWIAILPSRCDRYGTVASPTEGLRQFRGLRVAGLTCAETLDGRERILANLADREGVSWREVSAARAHTIARQLAIRTGGVVHLALFDEPNRVVWEPVVRP